MTGPNRWGKSCFVRGWVAFCVLVTLAIADVGFAETHAKRYDIHIVEAKLGAALTALALQTDKQLFFPYDLADVQGVQPVSGNYTIDEALDLMLRGTGFSGGLTDSGVITISRVTSTDSEGEVMESLDEKSSHNKRRGLLGVLAAVFSMGAGAQEALDMNDEDLELELEEIVVTGTNIRGLDQAASPIISFDRQDILESGFATSQEFLAALPQNFGAGATEATIGAANPTGEATSNLGAGAGVNLRGLGNNSTLTLINGRRIASGGFDASFADISSIPVSLISRVDVLTDGASAIYGTDAVAGVVNFLLRDDFDGAETNFRYGTVTEGDRREYQVSQLLGKSWQSGNAVISYEYYDVSALASAHRSFAAASDLTPFGGDNFDRLGGNPGTILNFFTGETAAIPEGQDGRSLLAADLVVGTANFQNLREGTDILPEQKRHTAFLAATQNVTNDVELFIEGRYAQRDFSLRTQPALQTVTILPGAAFFVDPFGGAPFLQVLYNFADDLGQPSASGEVESHGLTAGARIDLGSEWRAEIYGTLGQEQTENVISNIGIDPLALFVAANDPNPDTALNVFGDGANTPETTLNAIRLDEAGTRIDSDLWLINGLVDGPLFTLPGGAVRAALGGSYREETLSSESISSGDVLSDGLKREAFALFGEFFVPVVGEGNGRQGIESFSVTAAVRYEHYSDFGSTTNPKVGILYEPAQGLRLRASYGTSFRAPNLTNLDNSSPSLNSAFYEPAGVLTPIPTLNLRGANPDLQPEEATTWTGGFIYEPAFANGFSVSLTYFDVSYDGRIDSILRPTQDYLDDSAGFAPILNFDPSPEEINTALDSVPFFLDRGVSEAAIRDGTAPVALIIDQRLNNVAKTEIAGFDFGIDYVSEVFAGVASFTLNGSLLTQYDEAPLSTTQSVDVLDTFRFPVDLRMRGGAAWSKGGFGANLFVNYTGGYVDTQSMPERDVDTFTTVDVHLSYSFEYALDNKLLNGTTLSISVQNVFDNDPPFLNNLAGIGFDDEKASPLGRYVAVQFRKAW